MAASYFFSDHPFLDRQRNGLDDDRSIETCSLRFSKNDVPKMRPVPRCRTFLFRNWHDDDVATMQIVLQGGNDNRRAQLEPGMIREKNLDKHDVPWAEFRRLFSPFPEEERSVIPKTCYVSLHWLEVFILPFFSFVPVFRQQELYEFPDDDPVIAFQ